MSMPAFVLTEMLGETLADAVTAAQARLGDATVTARCEAGLWLVERAGAAVETGLTYEACVAAVEALA
jgi:hypothetical protein